MKTFLTAFFLLSVFSLNTFADRPDIRFEGHTGKIDSITLSPDEKTVASGSWDNTVRLWDITTHKEISTLIGHTGPVYSVAFSPDGKTIACGYYFSGIFLWDIATKRLIGIFCKIGQIVECQRS